MAATAQVMIGGSAPVKPLAQHPAFPLSSVELSRWVRFSKKGGIGLATAKVDKASEDGQKDLMFLEGDQIVVLMDLGAEVYLGFCEGVVGLFHGREVVMQQAKLKRPVMSSRSSSSAASPSLAPTTATSPPPSSPSPQVSPAQPACSPPRPLPRSTTSFEIHQAPASAVPLARLRPLSRSMSFELGCSSSSNTQAAAVRQSQNASRRKPVPQLEILDERFDHGIARSGREGSIDLRSRQRGDVAGLGIQVEGLHRGAMEQQEQPHTRRSRSLSREMAGVRDLLSSSRSPRLAGAFATFPSLHSSPDCATASPAPSAASSGTTRTPSLYTSPYSDFADRDDGSSSAGSAYLGPPVTPPPPPTGWVEDGDYSFDEGDGTTPTVEKLPVPRTGLRFPPPPPGDLEMLNLSPPPPLPPRDDPPPTTPKDFPPSLFRNLSSSTSSLVPSSAPPLKSQFSLDTLSSAAQSCSAFGAGRHQQTFSLRPDVLPRSAFSHSPNSSITSDLPLSILSASSFADQRERKAKTSSSTSIPSTPGEDPTLAFIFDSYRYSVASSGRNTPVENGSPVKSLKSPPRGTVGSDGAAENEEEQEDLVVDLPSPPRPVGAASQLRERIRLGSGPIPTSQPSFAPSATARACQTPLLSTSSSIEQAHLRRSTTADSLAMPSGCRSSDNATSLVLASHEVSEDGTVAQPEPVLALDDERSVEEEVPPASPSQNLREVQHAAPVTDAAHLAKDLAASRRLFQTYFSPPPKALADSAGRAVPRSRLVIGLPESPTQSSPLSSSALPPSDVPQRPRRKSAKGLQISSPVVPPLGEAGVPLSAPLRRSSHDSPVAQTILRANGRDDCFVASPVSLVPPHLQGVARAGGNTSQSSLTEQLHHAPPMRDYASSPSAGSHQTFSSAHSAVTPPLGTDSQQDVFAYPTPPSSAPISQSTFTGPPQPNKLRKGAQRMKSSPSLPSLTSHAVSALVDSPDRKASDPFTSLATSAPQLTKSSSGLFGRKSSSKEKGGKEEVKKDAPAASVERRVDYKAGISNKDLQEETVQIGKNAFEIVKPYAVLLGATAAEKEEKGGAQVEPQGAKMDHVRPSFLDDLVTPRRPPAPPLSATSASTPSSSSMSGHSHSTSTRSHFSPATPSSVEEGGKAAIEDHRMREAKWLQVLSSDMTSAQAKRSKKLRALAHSGVPSSVRGKVWAFLAGAEEEKKAGVYEVLCGAERNPTPPLLERDLDCMVFDHPQFAPGTAGREDLLSVLHAFARYEQQLVYYPGFVNMVALLLMQMPAEPAFWTLVSLCRNYGFKQFFAVGREELRLETLAFDFLLDSTEAKLAKRLRELSITSADYLPTWLSTFFLSVFPLQTTLRLVDLLLFDPKTRYRAPLALLDLSHLEVTLSFPSRDAVLNHLLAPPPQIFSPALLIPAIATTKVSDDKLKKAFKKGAQALLKPQAPTALR
ncbi:hypothetical protein JCM11641_003919 [Rhodosporidiobolus odoratus]